MMTYRRCSPISTSRCFHIARGDALSLAWVADLALINARP
jgi:hypothetical protein